MTCGRCGATVGRTGRCESCGATASRERALTGGPAGDAALDVELDVDLDGGLLLPAGRRGALVATLLAAVVFALAWGAFTWLAPPTTGATTAAPDPGGVGASPSAEPSRPAARPARDPVVASPSPTPTPATSPSPTPTGPDPAWTAVAERLGGAVVQVVGGRCEGPTRYGSGFVVAPRRVATAAHLVEGAPAIRVRQGRLERRAHVVGLDQARDLALLQFDTPLEGPVVRLAPAAVRVDDPVGVATVDDAGLPVVAPGMLTGVGLTVPSRTGPLSDVLRVTVADDDRAAGAAVLTPDGALAGMMLVDHVTSGVTGVGHALAPDVVAARIRTLAAGTPGPDRRCPRTTPTPTAPTAPATPGSTTPPGSGPSTGQAPTASPAPTPSPPATEPTPAPDDPFPRERWIAVLEQLPMNTFSLETATNRIDHWDVLLQLPRQGVRTRLLDARRWSSLVSDEWVLYLGEWRVRADAQSACRAIASITTTCTPHRLQR